MFLDTRYLLLCTLLALSSCGRQTDNPSLDELDSYLQERTAYESRKLESLDKGRYLLRRVQSPQLRYEACMDLADEFYSYQFDSTLAYLRESQSLARDIGDPLRQVRTDLAIARAYTTSGHFLEAYKSLYETIDSTALTPSLKKDYLCVLFRFSQDLAGNSGMIETFNIPDKAYYRDRLLPLLEKDSFEWRNIVIDQLIGEGRLAQADSLSQALVRSLDPHSHNFAIAAYNQSLISEFMGDSQGRLRWLVRSAEADIVNAVKDYASLTTIAQIVMDTDVDRSFRYLQQAQADAIFYNAKLRPWQISQFFMNIEQRYEARQQQFRRNSTLAAILMAILAGLLAFVVRLLVQRTRKLSKARIQQEEANARLAEMNDEQLSHIARFLGYLSDNVAQLRQDENRSRKLLKQGRSEELLKNLSASTRAEDALENFYRIFDDTFLGIFPDFVEQVNALLRPHAQLSPRKGERLCTELRIFALIRLGVTDSKDIARMLHYSVSTIYNYKVSVKNGVLGDRDAFEAQVQSIGKEN